MGKCVDGDVDVDVGEGGAAGGGGGEGELLCKLSNYQLENRRYLSSAQQPRRHTQIIKAPKLS